MNKTTQEQIELIRQAAIKANPAILDLTFGCEVIMPRPWLETLEMKAIFLEETKTGAYQFFLPTHADTLTVDLHIIDGLICDDGWEIIGRKIGLVDILLMIGKMKYNETTCVVNNDNTVTIVFAKCDKHGIVSSTTYGDYNLLNDDITLQSPELIAFVAGLLHG